VRERAGAVAAVLLAVLGCGALGSGTAVAQDTTAKAGPGQAELAKKLANPVSDLVSIPCQFNWENKVGPIYGPEQPPSTGAGSPATSRR
jgi:hypothetical protein